MEGDVQVIFTTTPETKSLLKAAARDHRSTLSRFIEQILVTYLVRQEEGRKGRK